MTIIFTDEIPLFKTPFPSDQIQGAEPGQWTSERPGGSTDGWHHVALPPRSSSAPKWRVIGTGSGGSRAGYRVFTITDTLISK